MDDGSAILPLEVPGYLIRDYAEDDLDDLCRLASNDQVWQQLGGAFPHPYTRADALAWLDRLAHQDPTTHFAIAGPDGFCGGIGLMLHVDPCRARDAELGFWLGRPYWGRGVATAAVRAFTAWARAVFGLHRLSAQVLATNPASARVLDKCGFRHEGTLRAAFRRDGRDHDLLLYGHLPGDGLTRKT